MKMLSIRVTKDFYPRPPRGGRLVGAAVGVDKADFYPRPPRGGRPAAASRPGQRTGISIHALREEGDILSLVRAGKLGISIHALREEGDRFRVGFFVVTLTFLSTPSARRATVAAAES